MKKTTKNGYSNAQQLRQYLPHAGWRKAEAVVATAKVAVPTAIGPSSMMDDSRGSGFCWFMKINYVKIKYIESYVIKPLINAKI